MVEGGNDGNGGNSGNPQIFVDTSEYVRNETFALYQRSQIDMCKAYREHQNSKIDSVRDELKGAIYLTSAILGLIITISSIILLVIGR